MLKLAAVLPRLDLCSVLLCWMHLTALGLERLLFLDCVACCCAGWSGRRWDWNDCNLLLLISTRQSNNISVLLSLWCLFWDRSSVSSARVATHVLQSSSKCKPVSGAIIALALTVQDPQYYREHWDVEASSRSCSSWTV